MTATSTLQSEDLLHELTFTTSRSSGPGGQNVNKVNSKVTLKWDVARSFILKPEQREMIFKKLAPRITTDGILMVTSQEKRSQFENKEAALLKLDQLLIKAFRIAKVRKATKPTKAAKQKRIKRKKYHSEKKQWRQKL